MRGSQSFDHYPTPKGTRVSRSQSRRSKQAVAAPEPAGGDAGVHYGKKFAETEARAHERIEHAAAAETPASTAPALRDPEAASAPSARATPIQAASGLWDEARRSVGEMGEAARDFLGATRHLGTLPREMARLFLRVGRDWLR